MNKATALRLLRDALKIYGGVLVSQGALDPDSMETIVGGVIALIGVLWSAWETRKKKEETK